MSAYPGLIRIVLDELANDPSIPDAATALRRRYLHPQLDRGVKDQLERIDIVKRIGMAEIITEKLAREQRRSIRSRRCRRSC